jgi:hypothetical protein
MMIANLTAQNEVEVQKKHSVLRELLAVKFWEQMPSTSRLRTASETVYDLRQSIIGLLGCSPEIPAFVCANLM